jgi:hypothetical protein
VRSGVEVRSLSTTPTSEYVRSDDAGLAGRLVILERDHKIDRSLAMADCDVFPGMVLEVLGNHLRIVHWGINAADRQ